MSASLYQTCFQIWKSNYERKGIQSEFKPLFIRYIGVEFIDQYDNILHTFKKNMEEHKDISLCFDGEIPLAEISIIEYFRQQIEQINVDHMTLEDICLFDGQIELSTRYLRSLNEIISIASENEHFRNLSVKRGFVTNLIVWSYQYLRETKLVMDGPVNAKCFYYGMLNRNEFYFLMLLSKMGLDVLYVNPLKEPEFIEEIDEHHISELHKNKQSLPIENFENRASKGKEINRLESYTLQIERELESTLYTDGVYRPWQFRKGSTNPILVHSTIEDLQAAYHEPAKVRTGFSVKDNIVRVPYFFQKIEGEYSDYEKYCELVQKCMKSDYVLFLSDRGESLLPTELNRDDMLSLAFCTSEDGTCDLERIKKQSFYPLVIYKTEVQNFILQKINEVLADTELFTCDFDKEDRLKLVMFYLHLDERIIRLIDNFDFPNQVPKLVLFLEHEDGLSNEVQLLLGFLSKAGFDLVIFDPSGMCNLDMISPERMDTIRLETMKYEQTLEQIKKEEKMGGFLRKLFH